jgi:hypothetical protein
MRKPGEALELWLMAIGLGLAVVVCLASIARAAAPLPFLDTGRMSTNIEDRRIELPPDPPIGERETIAYKTSSETWLIELVTPAKQVTDRIELEQ